MIAGGGVAGLTQGLTGILRAHSAVLTGGLGNFVISTAQLGGAILISFLALAAPAAAIALVVLSPSTQANGPRPISIPGPSPSLARR